ncbi:MAG: TetR/AcrR family transcriptional regulator [Dehalococcoidales bacterium]
MNVYERRIERNKERILQATLELFQVHGIKKTTTNDIAQQAGVSPATVYNHFGSKEDLVRAAVKYFLAGTAADFRKIFEEDISFLEKMGKILLYKSDMLGRYQGELMQTIISEDPEIRQLVDSVYMVETKQSIIDFYEEGKRQGFHRLPSTITSAARKTWYALPSSISLTVQRQTSAKFLRETFPSWKKWGKFFCISQICWAGTRES